MTRYPPFPRRAALVAGLGLAAMTGLGPLGMFTLQGLPDIAAAPDAAESRALLRPLLTALWAFAAIAVLDIVVAVGLDRVFRPVWPAMSRGAMILRIAYAIILAGLCLHLLAARRLVQGGTDDGIQGALQQVTVFSDGWGLSLSIFGLHLLALAAVGLRAPFLPGWIAWLVGLAGLGYLIDAIGLALTPDYALNLAAYVFLGELILMLWLLFRAFRPPRP
ncbi:DUF4386 domain-containing protein [Sinisalibacter aestuarii]|uniref:DUF4386 domain-containing protein n=1 Tax=Sinisalibacter aestuarii TaxID=2949426 RepID=A0ABQ5LUP9_9RHOB|nr:DUF4386 domain-containing protein [Sinisalibacter aestuarii]GKY88697.1 hypothetical protein STA1M1_25660 [Sinisalibacter aestuarii]